jgi:hypothetical protein
MYNRWNVDKIEEIRKVTGMLWVSYSRWEKIAPKHQIRKNYSMTMLI